MDDSLCNFISHIHDNNNNMYCWGSCVPQVIYTTQIKADRHSLLIAFKR